MLKVEVNEENNKEEHLVDFQRIVEHIPLEDVASVSETIPQDEFNNV